MAQDTKHQFSKLTVFFHWVVALTIIGLLCVGTYMNEFKVYSLYPIHKSVGMIIFLVILARIFWRIKNGWSQALATHNAFELKLAKVSHWILITGSVLFPISGMLMSAMEGRGLAIFGIELLAKNSVDGKVVAINRTLAELGETVHYWLAWIMAATIIVHIAGAVKHHFVYKDGTLRRMLGKRVDD